MKLKIFLSISILVSAILVFFITKLVHQNFDLVKQEHYQSTISLWITTPSLANSLIKFQEESNIKVSIKKFPDSTSLWKEFKNAQISGDIPDIIEMNANELSTTEKFNDMNAIPINPLIEDMINGLESSIMERFSDQGNLYAYPIGISIPIMIHNESILGGELTDLFPFAGTATLSRYQHRQTDIRNNKESMPFWLYHFDEDLDWYWKSKMLITGDEDTFHDSWDMLVNLYDLIPPLDHGMAITRFSNAEIGTLITSTSNLQTIQELVGNKFPIRVTPLINAETDPILVSGNGLIVLNNSHDSKRLFSFLGREENEKELLINEGWLPVKTKQLQKEAFIRQLPMAKYFQHLTPYQENFTGQLPINEGISPSSSILEQANGIEKGKGK